MKFNEVVIESMAYELPPEVWSSERIEEHLLPLYDRLKLPTGRLELMTGIRERRFWIDPIRPSEASALAGHAVLKQSQFSGEQMDLLMHTSVCRDRLEPATAAYVHGLMGLNASTQIFDVSNACLGFLNGMVIAASMIESGQIQRALVVAGENGKPLLERTIDTLLNGDLDRNGIKPYFANLTIGAGAVAAVLCHASLVNEPKPHLLGGVVETDTSHNTLCEGDTSVGDGLDMQTDSEELLNAGLGVAERAWGKFKSIMDWDEGIPDTIITHQVGKQHQRALFQRLGLDLERDFSTYPMLGNVGSVSLPVSLAMAQEQGRVSAGDKVALLGIGSGLSSLMLGLQL